MREQARQKASGRVMSTETKAKIAETLKARHAKETAEKALREGTPLKPFPFELVIIETQTAPTEEPIRVEFKFAPPTPDPNAWIAFESEDEAPAHS